MKNITVRQLVISQIRQVLREELQTIFDSKVVAEQKEILIGHGVVKMILELMQRIEDLEEHLSGILAVLESQAKERAAQKKWEDRERIGFKK